MPTIREATHQDVEQLLLLEQSLISAERPFARYLKHGKICYYDIPALIECENTHLAVMQQATQVVACGYAQLRNSAPHHNSDRHAYLGFMYTDPAFRGRGLNQKIIKHLQDWSAAQDVRHFRLDVFSENQAAVRAYEKSGFTVHMAEMIAEY